jgi:hypothetical protein
MYNYETQRNELFTESGQRLFLKIRDKANELLNTAGAFRMQEVMTGYGSGSTWDMLACVDRMVELGEIREVSGPGYVPGQYRIFTRT